MTVRWVSSGSDVLRPRKKPTAPKQNKPKYKSVAPTNRGPKLRKPKVERPFVENAMQRVAVSGEDMSLSELEMYDQGEGGPIVSIDWIVEASENCDGLEGKPGVLCRSLGGRKWRGLRQFLAGRTIAVSPNGKNVGLYGYSHPGCKCRLRVTMSDGSAAEVGPYS